MVPWILIRQMIWGQSVSRRLHLVASRMKTNSGYVAHWFQFGTNADVCDKKDKKGGTFDDDLACGGFLTTTSGIVAHWHLSLGAEKLTRFSPMVAHHPIHSHFSKKPPIFALFRSCLSISTHFCLGNVSRSIAMSRSSTDFISFAQLSFALGVCHKWLGWLL